MLCHGVHDKVPEIAACSNAVAVYNLVQSERRPFHQTEAAA